MTRREYLQSLKDQGKTKEEAIELTKQWEIDNKPVEVEKTEVVAKNTAPVTAQEESSTESSSEDTSLESTEAENDPENLGKEDLEVEKKSKGKIKVPKNSENIPEGKYDVVETYDLTSLSDEEKTKIQNSFNRKNVDLSNLAQDLEDEKNLNNDIDFNPSRLEEDTDRSVGNLVSLKKINYNYTEPETDQEMIKSLQLKLLKEVITYLYIRETVIGFTMTVFQKLKTF